MPNRLRACAWFLAGLMGCLSLAFVGCGSDEPPIISPDSEQYKEAKARAAVVRAKEYGRRSVTDKKATANPPASKKR